MCYIIFTYIITMLYTAIKLGSSYSSHILFNSAFFVDVSVSILIECFANKDYYEHFCESLNAWLICGALD